MNLSTAALPALAEPGTRLKSLNAAASTQALGRRFGSWLTKEALPAALGFAAFFLAWTLCSLIAADLPSPLVTGEKCCAFLRENFFGGPNRTGLPLLVLYSLMRVLTGFLAGALIAIPLGFLLGSSPFLKRCLHPLIEIFRPISPLAWYPVALVLFSAPLLENRLLKPPAMAAVFVIFVCSLWPTVLNTALGVSQTSQDYLNVARMLNMSRFQVFRRIYWPAALPHLVTGLRVSLGIAWMVIVAAEMLNGQDGIGFFCWDQYNAGSVECSILAMSLIGGIGLLLNVAMMRLEKVVRY